MAATAYQQPGLERRRDCGADVETGVSKPLVGAEDGGNDAVWSPNGKWIMFEVRAADRVEVVRANLGMSGRFFACPLGKLK